MSKAGGWSGTLSIANSGWSKVECKLDASTFTFTKGGGLKKAETKSIEMTKSAVVREYPKGFGKCIEFTFSISSGDVVYLFRAEKESERTAWFEAFAPHVSCYRVLAAHWATKCPKGTAVSKVFKPRYFILYEDRVSYYKDEALPEAGSVVLKPGLSDARVLWHLAKRYTISISPEPGAPLPLHMCFNLFENYEKWMKLLTTLLRLDYSLPIPNPNLFQPGVIVKEGLLEKKGERNKAWQTRYFLLKTGEAGGDSTMEYRKFNQFGKVCGEIEISDRMAILPIPKDERDNQFALSSKVNGRIFHLAAQEESERRSWIEMLTTASRTPKFAFSICEGFLQKRGLVNTAYQERYFVLLYDRLLYFKTKRDEAAAGEIAISKETTLCPDEDEENGFTLSRFVGTSRVYAIMAPDAVTLRYWMEKIAGAIEGKLLAPRPAQSLVSVRPSSNVAAQPAKPAQPSPPIQAKAPPAENTPKRPTGEKPPSEVKASPTTAEAEIAATCVCGTPYASADKQCRSCGVLRPTPLSHANKAVIGANRKRPVQRPFRPEEAALARVVQVTLDPKQAGLGAAVKAAEAAQRCAVEGCGKWEFQDGFCKAHLGGDKKPANATERPKTDVSPRPSSTKEAAKPTALPRSTSKANFAEETSPAPPSSASTPAPAKPAALPRSTSKANFAEETSPAPPASSSSSPAPAKLPRPPSKANNIAEETAPPLPSSAPGKPAALPRPASKANFTEETASLPSSSSTSKLPRPPSKANFAEETSRPSSSSSSSSSPPLLPDSLPPLLEEESGSSDA